MKCAVHCVHVYHRQAEMMTARRNYRYLSMTGRDDDCTEELQIPVDDRQRWWRQAEMMTTQRNYRYLSIVDVIQSVDSKLTLGQTSLCVNICNHFFHCIDGLFQQTVICMTYWCLKQTVSTWLYHCRHVTVPTSYVLTLHQCMCHTTLTRPQHYTTLLTLQTRHCTYHLGPYTIPMHMSHETTTLPRTTDIICHLWCHSSIKLVSSHRHWPH